MKISIEFAEERFERFNRNIFSGELPKPRFRLTHARTFRGKLTYRYTDTFFGRRKCSDFEMRFSLDFDADEKVWEDVVIHEMIHLHIASKGIRDSSSHGPVFRRIMNDINIRHGREITVTSRRTAGEDEADKRVRGHYMCIVKFSDGRLGVAPVAKTRIFELWDMHRQFPDVINVSWIGSTDPWFNRFPRVMRPKFYIASATEILPHLRGAMRLSREGNTIKAINPRCSPDELLP